MKINSLFWKLNNKGALKRHTLSFSIFILLLGLGFVVYTSAQDNARYTIVGDSVEWENEYGFIKVTPHTINGVEGCFNVTIKNYMATQDLDCALIADSNKLQLTSSEYLTTTSLNVSHSFACPTYNFSYTTNPNWATCYADNGSLLFNSRFETLDLPAKNVSWNVLTSTDRWNNIPANRIEKIVNNGRDVYAVTDVNFATNTEKKIRVCGNAVSKFNTEKFDVGCKKSTDTWSDVISSGNYIIVDPTWNYSEFIQINFNNCTSAYYSGTNQGGMRFTMNRSNVTLTNISIIQDCLPLAIRIYGAGTPPDGAPLFTWTNPGNSKLAVINLTLNNSITYRIVGGGSAWNDNFTEMYRNGDAGCFHGATSGSPPSPYAYYDGGTVRTGGGWTNNSNDYCFNQIGFANSTQINSNLSTESDARNATQTGIKNKIPSASIYTDQQIYVRYLNGTQMLGTFDKVAVYGNQRWAFNVISGSDQFTNMLNLTPSLYVWEGNSSLSTEQIQNQVETLISSTLGS